MSAPDTIEHHAAAMRAQLRVALGAYDPSYDATPEQVGRRLSRVWGRERIQRMRRAAAAFDAFCRGYHADRDSLTRAGFMDVTPIGDASWVEPASICRDGRGSYWMHKNAPCALMPLDGFTARVIRARDTEVWASVHPAEQIGDTLPEDAVADEWLRVSRIDWR
jgi:hypothetical protein